MDLRLHPHYVCSPDPFKDPANGSERIAMYSYGATIAIFYTPFASIPFILFFERNNGHSMQYFRVHSMWTDFEQTCIHFNFYIEVNGEAMWTDFTSIPTDPFAFIAHAQTKIK